MRESVCFPVKRLALKFLLLTRCQASVQAYETALKHVRSKPSTTSASPSGFKLYQAETLVSTVLIRANSWRLRPDPAIETYSDRSSAGVRVVTSRPKEAMTPYFVDTLRYCTAP